MPEQVSVALACPRIPNEHGERIVLNSTYCELSEKRRYERRRHFTQSGQSDSLDRHMDWPKLRATSLAHLINEVVA